MAFFTRVRNFIARQPLKTTGIIFVVWIVLAAANLVLRRLCPTLDTPLWFPVSLSSDPVFNAAGLPYAILFLLLLFLAVRERTADRGLLWIWLCGLVLIVLGNLIQGNMDMAFRKPLAGSIVPFQYYDDALKISSWREWLGAFNGRQAELFVHSRTHPPFAVLLHYFFIRLLGNHPLRVAGVFVLLSSLALAILGLIFDELGLERRKRNILVVLFSVIPAVNIYAAVSLDGVILSSSMLCLWGLVIQARRSGPTLGGTALIAGGIVLTNCLTFTGVFLLAAGSLVGIGEYVFKRRARVLVSVGIAIGLSGLLFYGLERFGHYNHAQAFLTASRLEHPFGFQGLTRPLNYVMTRIECAGELALFFSIGCLAALFHRERIKLSFSDYGNDIVRMALAGIVILGAMFAAGLNYTGETARSCLYIYPFLMLMFYRSDFVVVRDLAVMAGAQTALMQLFFYFFW